MHGIDTQMFQTLFPGHVVKCHPNILPISVINKQSGRGELEHRPSSQPPRWLDRLFAPLCSDKFLPSRPYQSRPQTHAEFLEEEAFSAAIIPMFLHESSSLRSGGQAGRMQGETRRGPARSVRVVLWKLDTATPLVENWLLRYYTDFTMRSSTQMSYCLVNSHMVAPGITVVCAQRWKTRGQFLTLLLWRRQPGTRLRSGDWWRLLDVFPCTDHLFSFMCIYVSR